MILGLCSTTEARNRRAAMTKQGFLEYFLNMCGASPDCPFDDDFETAHEGNL